MLFSDLCIVNKIYINHIEYLVAVATHFLCGVAESSDPEMARISKTKKGPFLQLILLVSSIRHNENKHN
jgi:hypothetical protein